MRVPSASWLGSSSTGRGAQDLRVWACFLKVALAFFPLLEVLGFIVYSNTSHWRFRVALPCFKAQEPGVYVRGSRFEAQDSHR